MKVLIGTCVCWFLLDIAYVPSLYPFTHLLADAGDAQILRHQPKPERRPTANRLRRFFRSSMDPSLEDRDWEYYHYRAWLRSWYVSPSSPLVLGKANVRGVLGQ